MIIPAIIPKTFSDIEHKVSLVKEVVARVQVDVLDGVYAPSASWPYNGADAEVFRELVTELRGLPFWELVSYEIDMMVTEPETKIDDWISAGAETLIIHLESTTKVEEIVDRARMRGAEVALALKSSTDLELLTPWIPHIAFVQCMGNDTIGFHGVSLDERVLDRLRALRERWPELPLGVDIGVNRDTLTRLAEAGATRFVAGSAVYGGNDPKAAIRELAQLIA